MEPHDIEIVGIVLQLVRPFEEKYGSFSDVEALKQRVLQAFETASKGNDFDDIGEIFDALSEIEVGIEQITRKHQLTYCPAGPGSNAGLIIFIDSLTFLEKQVNYLGAVVKYLLQSAHYYRYVAFALTDNGNRSWPPWPID